jgi:hypothetical protein
MDFRFCRVLGVSESGYYAWEDRPDPPRTLRRIWLAGEIADVQKASGGTYGKMRVTAELRSGRDVVVGHNAVGSIMGAVGSAYDNAMVESFWGRMKVELFNRKRWKIRAELANAIFTATSSCSTTLGGGTRRWMLTPAEYKDLHNATEQAA